MNIETQKTMLRLSGDARREAIIEAVKKVFAEKGFEATTTRELARAAGVSEALIFKHFPTKESLFDAMCDACIKGANAAEFTRIMSLEPSSSTLVILIHFLISKIANDHSEDAEIKQRLMLRSLLTDGEFARIMLDRFESRAMGKIEECIRAAEKSEDMREVPVRPSLRVWFAHHLAIGLRLMHIPEPPALNYKTSKDLLIEQATWFALLGMGLKDQVIRRYYNPKALSLLAK